jgi:hypothetical protein
MVVILLVNNDTFSKWKLYDKGDHNVTVMIKNLNTCLQRL